MKRRSLVSILLTLMLASSSLQAEDRFMIRSDSPELIEWLSLRLGLRITRRLGRGSKQTVVLEAPEYLASADVLERLAREDGIEDVEAVRRVFLPEVDRDDARKGARKRAERDGPSGISRIGRAARAGGSQIKAYLQQYAVEMLRLPRVHQRHGEGIGTIALIDTGVDPHHPMLAGHIVPGYDFINDVPGTASEWTDLPPPLGTGTLDQSTTALLDQSTTALLDQSTTTLLDQIGADSTDRAEHQAFGHGTMAAGILRLAAPGAKIMPLKVFDSDGVGRSSDIVRAIYYAVDNGAVVINMSFSLPEHSPSLLRAVNFATRRGVVCVASVGNDASEDLYYPAVLSNVVGVAATTAHDERSAVSNFGPDLVTLAAPGEGIVSTYPGSAYAEGHGTSFSAPFVSGVALLLLSMDKDVPHYLVAPALSTAKPLTTDLGHGRLDPLRALSWLRRRLGR